MQLAVSFCTGLQFDWTVGQMNFDWIVLEQLNSGQVVDGYVMCRFAVPMKKIYIWLCEVA